jgi:hypothetical protein
MLSVNHMVFKFSVVRMKQLHFTPYGGKGDAIWSKDHWHIPFGFILFAHSSIAN